MSADPGPHCNSEALLSFLDCELAEEERAVMERHLAACWLCRSRLQELEQTAQHVARLFSDSFVSPDRVAKAKGSFLEARIGIEAALRCDSIPATKPVTRRRWWRIALPMGVAAGLALAIAGYRREAPRTTLRDAPITASRVAEQSAASERKQIAGREIAHQVFGFEIDSVGAKAKVRKGSVELWADQVHGRYASRMFDEGGRMIHAVWHPGESGASLLTAAVMDRQGGWDAGIVQQRMKEWLDHRPGEPLLLAAEFVEFCRRARLKMTVTPMRGEQGDFLRLSAERVANGVRGELVLDVNANDYRPQRQMLMLSQGARRLEFRLDARQTDSLHAVDAALFQPVPLASDNHASVRGEADVKRTVQSSGEADPGALEVAALYALHGQGVFGRESWEVKRTNGKLRVRVVVPTEARKELILSALRDIDPEHRIEPDVQTWSQVDWQPPTPSPSVLAPISQAEATDALDIAKDVFSDAWALQQLAERFTPDRVAEMSKQSRTLLNRMLHDHLFGLQRASGELREDLAGVAGTEAVSGTHGAGDAGPDWQSQVHRLFVVSTRIHDRTNRLLIEPDPAKEPVRQAAGELMESIDRLAAEARDLDLTLMHAFEDL